MMNIPNPENRRQSAIPLSIVFVALLTLLLGACDDVKTRQYEITVTNVTNNQVLTPVAIAFHSQPHVWQTGTQASVGLETLAEGGDPSAWVSEIDAMTDTHTVTIDGVIPPGGSKSIMVEADQDRLSLATMLANTNDGFAAIDGLALQMEPGESVSKWMRVYDAGTEANSETAATIPGPAGGGEGFVADRDDLNLITTHRGVLGKEDGSSNSALDHSHRFLNFAGKLTIKRM